MKIMAGRSPLAASAEQRRELVALSRSRERGEADRARAIVLTLASWTSARIAEAFGVREDTVRIDTREGLEREIAAWERQRNAAGAGVTWMFTTEKPAPRWAAPIPSPPFLTSHNHRAEDRGQARCQACPRRQGGQRRASMMMLNGV
jgi:hypothetical protein